MDEARKKLQHAAIIMDGNGRWAAARGLPRVLGHRAGVQTVERIVEAAPDLGLKVLTLYAFSWENWERPSEEVRQLMSLLEEFIRVKVPKLLANDVRLRAIGRLHELPPGARQSLETAMAQTAGCAGMTLNLALSYGGRQEIVDAIRRLAADFQAGLLHPEQINEARFSRYLYAPDLPDPDLIIRTSGEQRLSNFLLWQASYAELYVTPKLWPDFTPEDLEEALIAYDRRERRFGRVGMAA